MSDAAKLALLAEFDTVLSLDLCEAAAKLREERNAAPSEEDAAIIAMIEARTAAKKAKNYAEADRIRNELKEQGIILEDTAQGVKWRRA